MSPSLVFSLLMMASADAEPVQSPQFEDLTGVIAPHVAHIDSPDANDYFAIGQAVADINANGFPDIYLTSAGSANVLLKNRGDGTFETWPIQAVELANHVSAGALFFDYDNDGWPDLLVLGNPSIHLFRNLSGQGFEEVTEAMGLAGLSIQGQSAAAGDLDGDGLLDLYIVGWFDRGHQWATDRLLRQHPGGGFEDWSDRLDVQVRGRAGFAVSMLDLDNSGRLDIYVVNDKLEGNALWRNDGPGCGGWCFSEVAEQAGALRPVFGMGLAHADIDHDGRLELYFSSIGEQVLLHNLSTPGQLDFAEASDATGVNFDAIGWAAEFVDFDLSGNQDLYLCTMDSESSRGNRLFRNVGQGVFEDVSGASGADDNGPTLGVAFADFDRDGRVDLVIGNWKDGYRFLKNQSDVTDRIWAGLVLEGAGPINREAIGARVYITDTSGRTQRRDVRAGSGMGGGSEKALVFGFDEYPPVSALVHWPDGTLQPIKVNPGQYQKIVYDPMVDRILHDRFEP